MPSLELCLVSPSAVMLRRDLFERIGGFDENFPVCEDYDLWLRIAARFGAPPDLAGVAMLPIGAGRDLLGVIELGRIGHSFRASDTETLTCVGEATLAALARR